MIETTPSMMKKATSTMVSENAPLIGRASSNPPTMMASTAETSDHQKPGACRMPKVVISPMKPLIRNSQPNTIVTASVAIGGTRMATTPRTSSRIPSAR